MMLCVWGMSCLAMVVDVQQVQTPQTPMAVDPAVGTSAETDMANRTALSSAAAQTARIKQNIDANTTNLANYARAQARYEQEMKQFEAAKAAIARKSAADAAAYQQRLAAWTAEKEVVVRACKPKPTQIASATAAGSATRMVCIMETPTGSMMPVRHCRTVAQSDTDHETAQRNLDANMQNSGVRLVNPR